MAKPRKDTHPVMVRLPGPMIEALDRLRMEKPEYPSRPDMIRRIVSDWLEENDRGRAATCASERAPPVGGRQRDAIVSGACLPGGCGAGSGSPGVMRQAPGSIPGFTAVRAPPSVEPGRERQQARFGVNRPGQPLRLCPPGAPERQCLGRPVGIRGRGEAQDRRLGSLDGGAQPDARADLAGRHDGTGGVRPGPGGLPTAAVPVHKRLPETGRQMVFGFERGRGRPSVQCRLQRPAGPD